MTARLVRILSVGLVLLAFVYIADLFNRWIIITNVQYVSIGLGVGLTLAFMLYPARRGAKRTRIPWYDYPFVLVSLVSTLYVAFGSAFWDHAIITGRAQWYEVALCVGLVLAVLEAARRIVGMAISLIAGGLFFYVAFGTSLGVTRIVSMVYFRSNGIFGFAITITFTVLVMFLVFGTFVQRSAASQFITNSALALTGRWSGGLAKAAVMGSAALGTVTGIGPANAAITGAVTIPLMKRSGYRKEFAAAVEAVASNGGTLLPPVMGLVVFMMAEIIGTSYWSICIAAFLPAVLYYVCVFMQVHFEAAKEGVHGLPLAELPDFWRVLGEGWFYLLPVAVLLYTLAVMDLPIQQVGMYTVIAAAIVIVLLMETRRETRRSAREVGQWLLDCLDDTGRQLVMPAVATAAAGIIMASIQASGVGFKMATTMLAISGGHVLVLLILVAAVSFVMGMGVPGIVTYIVLASLIAPTLVQMGLEPIAVHLFLLYCGTTALITPPVAMTVYVTSAIADSDPMRTGFAALRLGILTFVLPFVFIFEPALLLFGSISEAVLATCSALAGVVFLAAGVERYLFTHLGWPETALAMAGGVLMLWPGWMTDVVGLGLIVVLMALQPRVRRFLGLSHGEVSRAQPMEIPAIRASIATQEVDK